MWIVKTLWRLVGGSLSLISVQLLLFVAFAVWLRLAGEDGAATETFEKFFSLYGPGMDLFHSLAPEDLLADHEKLRGILSVSFSVVLYGVAAGVLYALGWPLLKLMVHRITPGKTS